MSDENSCSREKPNCFIRDDDDDDDDDDNNEDDD
jgi:hypothetical protein